MEHSITKEQKYYTPISINKNSEVNRGTFRKRVVLWQYLEQAMCSYRYLRINLITGIKKRA